MSDIILLLGVIGSGKDFRANQFIEDSKAFGKPMMQINFADELRSITWDILGWSPKDDYEYECFKKGCVNVILGKDGFYYPEHDLTGREFLQRIGTEAIRSRFKDFWAQLWSEKVKAAVESGKKVVCSDLRFINELEYAMKLCTGKNYRPMRKAFIFCNYLSDRYNATMNHASEKLSQRILKDGYQDGDELSFDYLSELALDEELRKEHGL